MEKLKPGDVVQLKSGSPFMTISYLEDIGLKVYCTWYEISNNTWHQDVQFPISVLKKVDA